MRLLQRIADSGEKNIQFGGFWWNILICDGILKRLTHYRSWRNPSNCRYFHYQEIGLLIMSRGPRLAFHFQCGGWDVHPEKVTVGVENLCMSTFNTGEELSLDTISLVSFLYHFEALSLTASLRQYAVFKNVPQMPDYSKISVSEVSHLLKRSHTHYYYFSLTSFFFFFFTSPSLSHNFGWPIPPTCTHYFKDWGSAQLVSRQKRKKKWDDRLRLKPFC